MPKVSIIIPVYNTQDYVKQAVDSIIHQTLQDIEIIIVNDGSTDDSFKILQELASTDKRIKLYSQENQGLSNTRNRGIEVASGDYIYFMDSDDLLDKNALKECYEKCEKENLDFVFFNADVIHESTDSSFQMDYHHSGIEDRVYSGVEILNYLLDTWQFKSPVYLNVIRASYYKENNFSFYPGIIHEDQLFTMLLYIKANRVSYIDKDFFKRRIREASIMTQKISWKNVVGYFTVFDQLNIFSKGKAPIIRNTIKKHIKITLNAFLYNVSLHPFKDKVKLLKFCIQSGYLKYIEINVLIKFILPLRLIKEKIK
ncbi:glycosyltransferase [Bacteroides sp. 224]|uniref:glycosyltransferase n=1 Tax=Bacteroides sp. 224 TaxID=2302936 RepID=UPI0013D273BC|nr:glycosyltransferase [Bacteroides sp. 224]NDV65184.1 glycosyltransferase [Bacteroides sp. 224]